jgi:hypothetical protein
LQGSFAIEHIEDGKLLFMEAEVIESYGFFDDPINPAMIFVAS